MARTIASCVAVSSRVVRSITQPDWGSSVKCLVMLSLQVSDIQFPGAYYLTECDEYGRRAYHPVKYPDISLRAPPRIPI